MCVNNKDEFVETTYLYVTLKYARDGIMNGKLHVKQQLSCQSTRGEVSPLYCSLDSRFRIKNDQYLNMNLCVYSSLRL